MSKILKYTSLAVTLFLIFIFNACKDDTDSREYEAPEIVGVQIDDVLYTPTNSDNVSTVVLTEGTDLTALDVQVLVTNGTIASDFVNNTEMDCQKPLTLTINGYDGSATTWTLKIQSPPSLSTFIIEGLTLDDDDIHFGSSSLIVEVPENTDLTALSVTMEFVNGTLVDFTNGVAQDYTDTHTFQVLGVDAETIYSYDLVITTDEVGPATIKSMTINGVETDSISISSYVVTPYVKGLSDFSSATVTLEVGYGNTIDDSFTGTELDLLDGSASVVISGTDGVETTFTFDIPQLSLTPVLEKEYTDFGFGSDAGSAIALSGNYFVVANHNTSGTTPVGPNYYDLSGNRVDILSKDGTTIDGGAVTGIRKLASDDNGEILGVQLGAGASTSKVLNIYRWSSVTATPSVYISYTGSDLGLSYGPRAAGINISGSLSGDAVITVPMAKNQEVLVWKVKDGVLTSTTPSILTFPYASMGYYYSVQPMPIGLSGYVGAGTGSNLNGIISLSSTLSEITKLTGMVTTDCDVYEYNDRVYLAYTVFLSGKGAYMRVCDITDGNSDSFSNPIMNVLMPSTASNGNGTVDADFSIVNGKLYVAFICSNIGARIYKLEQ